MALTIEVSQSTATPPAPRWPRYQHVIFDCDSTLSAVEGIDALAQDPDLRDRIAGLTAQAMSGQVSLQEVYGQRLDLIRPTRGAIRRLREVYKKNVVADAAALVGALGALGHEIYIVSGGLLEPVREFGRWLGVAASHVRAVEVEYDALSGQWWMAGAAQADLEQNYLDYEPSELSVSDGKARIIDELLAGRPGRSLLVGDGASDLAAASAVDLFVGFGGVVRRPQVAGAAPVYLDCPSLAPVLVLAGHLDPATLASRGIDHELVRTAVRCIDGGALSFNDRALASRFQACVDAARPAAEWFGAPS